MALDLNDIAAAVYTKLNVSDITDTATGGVHYHKAPQGTDYPYITFWFVSDVPDDGFNEWRDDALLQIDVWSDSNSAYECQNIMKLVATEMDEASLSPTNYSAFFCQRSMTHLLFEDELNIYHGILEYRVMFEKNK